MRRIWAVAAAVMVGLAFGGLPAVAQESSEQPSAQDTTIGFTNFFADGGFFSGIEEGAREAATAAGVELLVETAWGSATTQASQVTDFIESGVDAIIITPIDPDAIVASVEAANAAGIPVLAVDRAASGGTVASVIASDNVAAGRMAGQALFEVMGGSGKVIEIQGDMAVSSGSLRSEGFGEALAGAPDITLAVQAPADFDYGTAYKATMQALEEDPEITGVFASNLDMLYGAVQGVSAADKQGEVRVVGVDADPDILEMVKDGIIDATVAQQPDLMGQRAVEAALAVLAGESVEPFIPVQSILVTQDNVDEFVTGEAVPAQDESPATWGPTTVTGTEVCGDRTGGTSSAHGLIESERGWVAECVNTMSDSRVDGTYVNTLNMDCYPSGMCLLWGTHVLDGPEGGWDCSWAGALYPNDLGGFMSTSVCPGTGGFDGLTYVFQHGNASFEGGSPFGDDNTFDGVIYEGPAPMVFATQSEANE